MSPAEYQGPGLPQPAWLVLAALAWVIALMLGKWWFGA